MLYALMTHCRKRAYVEVEVAGESIGKVEFELANDVLPTTCENFMQLCGGGATTPGGVPLTYKVNSSCARTCFSSPVIVSRRRRQPHAHVVDCT
jgi:Cyclophilin type peptidyl-prolyl cis-trans isomerase/CLD